MQLTELHLKAFGPFTGQVLPLGSGSQRLVLVYGLNEAGKSSALRAITSLHFGIPPRTADKFVHDYGQMRVGGVFVDSQGQSYSLMRRKGTGITLRFADFSNGGVELAEPVPPAVNRLLTAGLSPEDYQSMFGLDHVALRRGGEALARGEGEIGAALFEASSGSSDVPKILAELDASAKRFYMPAAQAKNGRVNQALGEYKTQVENYKAAQVKPARWQAAETTSREARQVLEAAIQQLQAHEKNLALVRELMAVAPILATLAHAHAVGEGLAGQPLLAENAAAVRAAAEAGLSDAVADTAVHAMALAAQQEVLARLLPDPAILAVGQSVSRLNAAAGTVSQLRGQIAMAEADIASRTQALDLLAARINPAA
jgi:exonuclease SbcC